MSSNKNDITVVESESDDESHSSEFNFAVAVQLRKNLTETFDKHVHSSNISEKIAKFEQQAKPPVHVTNKPPRQQKPPTKSTALGVYLRVRPVADKDSAAATTLEIQPTVKPTHAPTTVRTFPPVDSNAAKVSRDSSSEGDSSQQQVYSTVAAPLVSGLFPSSTTTSNSKLVGESALLFAYGITNAGKTHTIMGDVKEKESMGIIPRALQHIFAHLEERDTKYDLNMSYMEVYNEGIYDLLPKETKEKTFPGTKQTLKLRESQHGQTFVRGLAKHRVESVADGLQLAQQASLKRHPTISMPTRVARTVSVNSNLPFRHPFLLPWPMTTTTTTTMLPQRQMGTLPMTKLHDLSTDVTRLSPCGLLILPEANVPSALASCKALWGKRRRPSSTRHSWSSCGVYQSCGATKAAVPQQPTLYLFANPNWRTCLWITWRVQVRIAHSWLSMSILLWLTLMRRNTSWPMRRQHEQFKLVRMKCIANERTWVVTWKRRMITMAAPWKGSSRARNKER